MLKRTDVFLAFIFLFFLLPAEVSAHRPVFSDREASGPESAIRIESPEISQVVYRELSDEKPTLWLDLEVEAGFELYVQIGLPLIQRLAEFRPSMAVLGPGLPEIEPPFPKPEGTGGLLIETGNITNPRVFHEPFTRTDSWILHSRTIHLKEKGRYFIVAFASEKKRGKLWIAVGKRESFQPADLLRFGEWTRKIRRFHEAGVLLIDDFSRTDGLSALGTRWSMFTDRVMGGVSNARSGYQTIQGSRCLRLEGNVSLENNGGFVQVALPLQPGSLPFDASRFQGVRLRTCGNGQPYYVHLRTTRTTLPWQYYSARFDTGENWHWIEIPFDRFIPQNLSASLETSSLTRIAVVGAKKSFEADVAVSIVEFYR